MAGHRIQALVHVLLKQEMPETITGQGLAAGITAIGDGQDFYAQSLNQILPVGMALFPALAVTLTTLSDIIE